MKIKKEMVVLVLAIAGLSLYIALKKTDRRQYTLPEGVPVEAEDISRVEIRRGDGTAVGLKREAERWLIQPAGHRADPAQVDDMVDLLAGLTITAVASEAGNEPVYELDPEHRIEVDAYDGETAVRRVFIGKAAPTGRHTFVMIPGDERIYHARENLRSRFDKDADRLRDKQVLKIDEDVTEALLTEGGRQVRLIKGPPEAAPLETGAASGGPDAAVPAPVRESVWRTEAGKPVKAREVEALVRTLSNLRCTGFPAEGAREKLGAPAFTVTLKGAGSYELSLYGAEDGKVLATSSQSEDVFYLPEWQAKRVELDLENLEETGGNGA